MNTRILTVVAASAALLYAAKPEYEAGVVLVKLRPGTAAAACTHVRAAAGATLDKRYALVGIEKWRIDRSMDAAAAAQAIAGLPGIVYAQPNYRYQATRTPNDPMFTDLWGMDNTGQTGGTPDAGIDAPEAWDFSVGNNTIVAVIDTGVDYTHPDLASNMWRNPGEVPANGFDDDGNGYIDDVYGIDACNGDTDPMDDNNHGTHCSGTIGGVGDNGVGVVGVCWNARIMACKFLDAAGNGFTADAIECIQYAARMGARVINASWGDSVYDAALADAIEVANKSNILFCAAAGNTGTDNDLYPVYPASLSNANILAVAASDADDMLAGFSCYGSNSVDIAAPGAAIMSTLWGGGYGYGNGTSMATPHCAGAAALLLSVDPGLNAAQLKAALMHTADPKLALGGTCMSGARLNVYRAVLSAAAGDSTWYQFIKLTPTQKGNMKAQFFYNSPDRPDIIRVPVSFGINEYKYEFNQTNTIDDMFYWKKQGTKYYYLRYLDAWGKVKMQVDVKQQRATLSIDRANLTAFSTNRTGFHATHLVIGDIVNDESPWFSSLTHQGTMGYSTNVFWVRNMSLTYNTGAGDRLVVRGIVKSSASPTNLPTVFPMLLTFSGHGDVGPLELFTNVMTATWLAGGNYAVSGEMTGLVNFKTGRLSLQRRSPISSIAANYQTNVCFQLRLQCGASNEFDQTISARAKAVRRNRITY